MHRLGGSLDHDLLRDGPDLQSHIDGRGLSDCDQIAPRDEFPEAVGFDIQLIGTRLDRFESVCPGGGRRGLKCDAGTFIDEFDRCVWYDRSGRIL